MSIYCPKCGNKLEENFKFCPDCGKNLKGKFAFCPECGKKMILSEGIVPTPEKKEVFKAKKRKLPKLSLHIPKKTVIAIVAIVCIVAVVGATAIVLYPFDTAVVKSGGRTFTITVENTFGSEAECYLKVGALKHGGTFTVLSGETKAINVDEDNLISSLLGSDYEITLYATINDIMEEATADSVTESANFLISEYVANEHQVECTSYQ
ncbi:MAG: zinc ribbon domain-containing protein [Thermoplasmatales archaeon]|nr:MAG: zinc ribbon domain-containing protein [Thermoplasmatales archaeon]